MTDKEYKKLMNCIRALSCRLTAIEDSVNTLTTTTSTTTTTTAAP